jgi:hypothetical protein
LTLCKSCLSLCNVKLQIMTTLARKIFFYQKPIAIAMIVLGIPIALTSKSTDSTGTLVGGLFLLFITWDKIMDERLISLKATSMYAAIFLSYAFQTITAQLYKQSFISYEMTNINHFMILIFGLANMIYYIRFYASFNPKNE